MLREKHAGDLHEALKARIGDAVVSVSIGHKTDRSQWFVVYAPSITPQQQQAAAEIVSNWSFDGLIDIPVEDLNQKVARLEAFIDTLTKEAASRIGG